MSVDLSCVKIRCELWSVGELTKQEEAKSTKKNRESGTVYFTHMGSSSRKTDRYEIWQISSPDRRNLIVQNLVSIGTAVLALERCKVDPLP